MLEVWPRENPQMKYSGKVNEVLSSIIRDAARARIMAEKAKDEIEFYVAKAHVAMAADEFEKLYILDIIDEEDYKKFIDYCNGIAEKIKTCGRREAYLCKKNARQMAL